jgi:hypothetical protein
MPEDVPPGWYPDPVGDHELRWWDGEAWTETVRTGDHQGTAPLRKVEVPTAEQVLWSRGPEMITTHRVLLREGRYPVELPWWMVRGVEARGNDVVLRIGYPGYTDKSERRIRGLPNAPEIAALCLTWARRHHRAQAR